MFVRQGLRGVYSGLLRIGSRWAWKDVAAGTELRNIADSAYGDLTVNNLVVNGNITGGGGAGASGFTTTNITLWHDAAIFISGAGLTSVRSTSYNFGTLFYQNPGALNDEWYHPVALKAGSWTLKMLCHTENDSPRIQFRLDSQTSFGEIDLYSAAITSNVYKTLNFSIAADGIYNLYGKCASKNAASSGYYAFITKITLQRTGA